ncbi:MAG: LysR family transcriptional regulator [Rhodocyclaceae bacterium]|nr:LysR family transcriptional regulator [Rhodocyclaceae bacterium]
MPRDRLNWNDLRYFLEVARTGRLLGAARRLAVNHATVGRRIDALEQALAVKLFVRDEQGYHLTPAGEDLLPLAQQVEDVTGLARERSSSPPHSLSGSVRIGTPDGFGNAFLAGNLARFLDAHQELRIELLSIPLTHNLKKREVDLAISLEPSDNRDIHCEKITDYRLQLFASADFLHRHGIAPDDFDAITRHTFADYITDILYTEQLSFNRRIRPGLRNRLQSATVQAQYEFIAHGGGFGVLPNYMGDHDPRLVPVLTERVSFIRAYWLLIPLELRRLARIRGLERFILATARERRDLFLPPALTDPTGIAAQ